MDLEHPLFIDLSRLLGAISDYPGNATVRKVVCDVAQFANRYGRAFPTMRSVAARTSLSPMTVCRSYRIAEETGIWTITKEKKGLDRHPRDVVHYAKQFIRRRPDRQSTHFILEKWNRWCAIGKKRAERKKAAAGTVRDTAAHMAKNRQPSAAQLTPAQARETRRERGGGFAELSDALRGMGLLGAPTTAAPAVKDTYKTENQQRGDLLQQLREHKAAAAMASQPIQAAPMSTAPAVPPIQQPPTRPTASEQRERKAQAYEELQPLRERLRQQAAPPAPQAPTDDTAGAVQDVARDYARASKRAAYPADSSSPWPASTAPAQPIQQAQATADMRRDARAAWLAGLEATRRQAARDAARMARQHEPQKFAAAVPGATR